ncbi:dolichyl-phosphate-mannose--protein mannosyltransferase [Leptodesmis sp.]|uniref:dolichyl-phosphate-mannose--protein mannosyltransferase n=1 Tax=Leptodesmis sp. TaxID=3100501 RepID=UPI004053502C
MPLLKKIAQPSLPWFSLGILALLIVSLGLRFWGLGRFNTLVFDEVYYAKFAYNYLSSTPFFDGHPPLSKYLIAIAMALGSQVPTPQTAMNGLTGGLFAPWMYRWLNALTGSFIPLVILGIAYQLTHRRRYALITGWFAALDGLFLVESRYALNNVYLVIFGLLGLWFLLLALNSAQSLRRSGWLVLSGISFGASASIKWNGLWFLLGAYSLWIVAQGIEWFQASHPMAATSTVQESSPAEIPKDGHSSPLQRLHRLRWWQVGLYWGIVPALTYILEWIPHLKLNAKQGLWPDFWALQVEILQYHERVGNGPKIHPYCSNWYSWLFMWRPVAYFYKVTGKGDPLPTEATLPPTTAEKVVYDVHAMGNPFLWWFSTIAIFTVLAILGWLAFQAISNRIVAHTSRTIPPVVIPPPLPFSPCERWLMLFLAINYLANLLPWVKVTRCTFLYHYMGASVFATMAIAWLVDRWLSSRQPYLRQIGLTVIAIVAIAFLFWLPVYLGLPLSLEGFKLRMWLPSWV